MKLSITPIILTSLLFLPTLAQKPQTDRDVAGLKGPVKTVLIESADLVSGSGKLVEQRRQPESQTSYDAGGNLTTEKFYSDGILFSSNNYSSIDGNKVSIAEDVDNGSVIITSRPLTDKPSAQSNQRSDERYTYRYKYKYDGNGNRREETTYQNNGELWLRRVYNLKRNKKEELVYSEDGSLNQKYVYTLDEKGNEVEMHVYDTEKNSVESKEIYKYEEFDSQGNWTKRTTSGGEKDSNFSLKPLKVTYRKITYLDQ